ncbi:FKBP-type peptidyl-prolyl cis-trans isomerase [Modestobacter versicolor]|uniref:Peptidyl-prolyl cis-trans isomerase n=1 Tax=Modestobacter versicolor TaxID=429133 RepID=A0A323V9E6_9ACTN|nr:FKBP-type peptidyl-prolyl cis-trans isomerase [Modestobacter versicolor]MBB3676810.1 peptidylprolyl isomerase [Modestobacter versicolor]PZA21394.1 FKBP-type peptidyl-prolyl cis-trans isomerase [Modestobacter versicolor]
MDRRTAARLFVAAAVAFSLTACGGDDEPSSSASPSDAACVSRSATAQSADGLSTDLSSAPEVPTTDAAPPCGLEVTDVVVGTGPEAVAGSAVEVKYLGAFYGTGEEFDSSWSRGDDETLPVTLGAGQVIEGFDQGITGMQVGGRRMVTIPSDLGYGPNGQGPIPGDATLVFVIDLVQVG